MTIIIPGEVILAPILFLIAIIELWHSIQILFFDREKYFVTFQIFFLLYKLLPMKKERKQKRLNHAISVYKQRMKIYARRWLIGSVFSVIYFGWEILKMVN